MASLSDEVRQAVDASGLGRNEVGRRARIDKAALSRFMAGQAGLSMAALDRLAEVLELKIVSPGLLIHRPPKRAKGGRGSRTGRAPKGKRRKGKC